MEKINEIKLYQKKYHKEYYKQHLAEYKITNKLYYQNKMNEMKLYQKEYYKQRAEEYKIKNKLYYENNKKDIIAYNKEYKFFNYHRSRKEVKDLIINNDLIKVEKRLITISFD